MESWFQNFYNFQSLPSKEAVGNLNHNPKQNFHDLICLSHKNLIKHKNSIFSTKSIIERYLVGLLNNNLMYDQ